MWNGYATTRVTVGPNKSPVHRIAYELANGVTLERGIVVMHKCDVRLCCEPSHLQAGTYSENTLDMMAKGRGLCGKPRRRKLTMDQAEEMRAAYAHGGVTQNDLAEKYGIASQNISLILQGKTYTGKKYAKPTGIMSSPETRAKISATKRARFAGKRAMANMATAFASVADCIRNELECAAVRAEMLSRRPQQSFTYAA